MLHGILEPLGQWKGLFRGPINPEPPSQQPDPPRYLLSKRASPDVADNRGRTPLFHADPWLQNHGNALMFSMIGPFYKKGSCRGHGT